MKSLSFPRRSLLTMLPALFAMTLSSARAQEPKLLADTSEVHLTVRDTSGMPIQNARVEMVILNRGRDQSSMEVRTDDNGTIEQDIIPIGDVVRMQISAPGYQEFGINYPVNGLVKDLVVRLKQQPALQAAVSVPPSPAAAGASQATFTYKEAQWVNKHAHRSASKAYGVAKSASKADPAKSTDALAKPSAAQ